MAHLTPPLHPIYNIQYSKSSPASGFARLDEFAGAPPGNPSSVPLSTPVHHQRRDRAGDRGRTVSDAVGRRFIHQGNACGSSRPAWSPMSSRAAPSSPYRSTRRSQRCVPTQPPRPLQDPAANHCGAASSSRIGNSSKLPKSQSPRCVAPQGGGGRTSDSRPKPLGQTLMSLKNLDPRRAAMNRE